jgi:hypothetical protein
MVCAPNLYVSVRRYADGDRALITYYLMPSTKLKRKSGCLG